MHYKDFINTLLERKSDVQFSDFVREFLARLAENMEEQIGNLIEKLESLVTDPRSLGVFDAIRNEKFKSEVESSNPEHPLVELWQRAVARVKTKDFQNDRLFRNYKRFATAVESLPNVLFEVDFRDVDDAIGQYTIRASAGKILRNRYRHEIAISGDLHKFALCYDDLFACYQYLIWLNMYYPERLAEERDFYDDLIADDRSVLTSMTEYADVRRIVTHELRHAYDMLAHGTGTFSDLNIDDKTTGRQNYRLASKSVMDAMKQRFKDIFRDDIDDRKLGYFLSNHETNAYISEILNVLREFLDKHRDELRDKENNRVLREFFNDLRVNPTYIATSNIFRVAGTYKKFIGRLFTFINEYKESKNV